MAKQIKADLRRGRLKKGKPRKSKRNKYGVRGAGRKN